METTVIYTKKDFQKYKDYRIFENCYVISKEKNNFDKIEFSGSGIFNDEFITNNMTHNNKFNFLINKNIADNLQINMRGSLCATILNKENDELFIVPDPLGSAIIFYYDCPSMKIFSTTLEGILEVLKQLDITVEKNIDYFLEVMTLGKSGFIESPYHNIYSLKPFQYIMINEKSINIIDNTLKENIIEESKSMSVETLCERIEKDIEKNLKLVTEHQNKGLKISHLTGGFDSRLIAASLFNKNNSNLYYFSCSGRKGSADKDISVNLSKHFGFIHSNFAGNIAKEVPQNYEEDIMWGLNYTNGLLANINPTYLNEDNVILSGGYGESYRTFYTKNINFNDYNSLEEIAYKLWPALNINKDKAIVTKEFVQEFIKRFRTIILEGLESGIPEESVLDYLYLRIRNRYFVGQISFYHSLKNTRFDPLYSIYGSLGSLYQPLEIRRSNTIGLRLLQKASSEMLNLPFDSERITETFEELYGKQPRLKFKENYKFKEFKKDMPENKSIRKKATKEHEEKANKIRAYLYQVLEEENAKKGLKTVLLNTNIEIKNRYLNLEIINNLINKEINNRVDLRILHNLYRNLLWYGKN